MRYTTLTLASLCTLCIATCFAAPLTATQKAQFSKAQKNGKPYATFSDDKTDGGICVVKATVCKKSARDMSLVTPITANPADKRDALIAFLADKPKEMSKVDHDDTLKAKFFAYSKDKTGLKKIKTSGDADKMYVDVYMYLEKPKVGTPDWKSYFNHFWLDAIYHADGNISCPAYTLKSVVTADEYEKAFPSSK